MKRKAIGGSTYLDEHKGYWARPTIDGKRTWRKLKAISNAKAIKEANSTDYIARADTFAGLAEMWVAAGCPGKLRLPLTDGSDEMIAEQKRVENLTRHFGHYRCDAIRKKHLDAYAQWRMKQCQRGRGGGCTVRLDLVTLSNIQRFGELNGHLEFNYIERGRRPYHRNPRHAREVMPETAEIIHRIAAELFGHVASEVHAWHGFFAEFTGCRTSELLRLRLDAKNDQAGGFIQWLPAAELKGRADDTIGHLYLGRRSKNGMNPWARIGPEFGEMIKAFLHWHQVRFGEDRHEPGKQDEPNWFFPGRISSECIHRHSFGHAVVRVTKALKLGHITPHGYRAFFATKRLRDGARTVDIAAEMGDKTVSLVETIYAAHPDGRKLWWTPADGLPAWQKWLPADKGSEKASVLDSLRTTVT